MRARVERRIRKQLRNQLRKWRQSPDSVAMLRKCQQSRTSIVPALRSVVLNRGDWYLRGVAAQLLGIDTGSGVAADLLDIFYGQTEKTELWETALTIERFGHPSAIPRLIDALRDDNPHRRHGAARALGWIWPVTKPAAKALVQALLDTSQPQPVREEAAESLAYSNYPPAIPPLISVLNEPDVRIRFWAVIALGGIAYERTRSGHDHTDPRVIDALIRMLPDEEAPPGNWWSVGREALAMLAKSDPRYEGELAQQAQRIRSDPAASPEDLRWVESYGDMF